MDDHPNFGYFLRIGIFLIGVVKGRHKHDNYAIYSEIPLTEHFSFLIDAAYRTADQMNGNQWSWGDREGLFAKVGIVSTF